ncbi:ras guanine nucleotide exchange factor domain-containing protein [Dissophora ornata]|nr:ras guanine nucleotide exchange factor domain-containing protein [Dissophora ornata]
MLRQVWKAKKGSAAFQACIAHFNYISSWVGTMILLPSKTKHRAKMMDKFISVAKILREMGNFNTLMAILAAMNTSSIHRLNQTREHLQGKDIWNTLKDLEHLMSSERSFFEYRTALRGAKLPCIPYLGVHLADLFSISEGNRDYRQDNIHKTSLDGDGKPLLHWQKFVLMTDIISMVTGFQKEPCYRIKSDPLVRKLIMSVCVLDEEELYTKSVCVEPGKLNHSRSLSKFAFF